MVFRCQFCECRPDPATHGELMAQLEDAFFGRYVDAAPSRWLTWHGQGPLGPKRYACPEHRGELTAYLRFHYGTVAPNAWKMGPYPRPELRAGYARSSDIGRHGGSGFAI